MLSKQYPNIWEYPEGRKVGSTCQELLDHLCFNIGMLEDFADATNDFLNHYDDYRGQLEEAVREQLAFEMQTDVIGDVNSNSEI